MVDFYDAPSLDGDLTDEEYRLFFTEAEALTEEELFDDPGQKDLLQSGNLTQEERKSWDEKKQELNHWGLVFSQGGPEAIIAAEKLQSILYGIVQHYDDDNDKSKAKAEDAHRKMVSRFPGSRDKTVRFLSHYYPEQLLYNAINMTIGWGLCRDDTPSTRRYDHRKGASFVTYFNNLLYSLTKDEQRYLARRWKHTGEYTDAAQDTASLQQYRNRPKTTDRKAITTFAQLTDGVLRLGYHLPAPNAKHNSAINTEYLQLFYTLQLVNFSRFDGDRGGWDYVIMDAADPSFLTFSTTLEDTGHYPALQAAALSRLVYEKKLYKQQAQEDVLADLSVAYHTGTTKENVSRHFAKIKARLNGPILNALKVCED